MYIRQTAALDKSGLWTIYKKQIKQKFKVTGGSQYIYQNEIDKACFQHDMAYDDFKDLYRRTASDKILHDKASHIAKNLKYDGYQCRLASMVYKFFDKKTSDNGIKNENISNKELAKELHKPIIKNEKYTHLLQTIFGLLILLICN